MAAKAFVLIETAVGRSKEVVVALKELKGVASVDTVTGPYDVIAIVQGETLNNIGDNPPRPQIPIRPSPPMARRIGKPMTK